MPVRYGIRITKDNIALIRALSPAVDIDVNEDQDRWFLFAVDSNNSTTEHDVTACGIEGYEDPQKVKRILFQ